MTIINTLQKSPNPLEDLYTSLPALAAKKSKIILRLFDGNVSVWRVKSTDKRHTLSVTLSVKTSY